MEGGLDMAIVYICNKVYSLDADDGTEAFSIVCYNDSPERIFDLMQGVTQVVGKYSREGLDYLIPPEQPKTLYKH